MSFKYQNPLGGLYALSGSSRRAPSGEMSFLSWNCRGLGQSPTIQELACLVHKFCPKVVFISETRQQSYRVNNLWFRLGFNKAFIVDSQGKGGGLVLFWDESINIQILSYGYHYIYTLIWDVEHHAHWRGTFFYREPRTQDRGEMWELIKWLKPLSGAPWMLIGDFNEAMWSFEHFSSRRRPEWQMYAFHDILEHL
jgi:hypothetical protein